MTGETKAWALSSKCVNKTAYLVSQTHLIELSFKSWKILEHLEPRPLGQEISSFRFR